MITEDQSSFADQSKSNFLNRYQAGEAQVIYKRSVNDTDTPVSAYLKITKAGTNSFLLESVEGGENLGRYSIIGMKPDLIWRAKNGRVEINRNALTCPSSFAAIEERMMPSLKSIIAESRIELPSELSQILPPMFAGIFGYFGYDTVNEVEELPRNEENQLDLHDAIFIRPSVIAIFDNLKREIVFVAPIWPNQDVSAEEAFRKSQKAIEEAEAALESGSHKLEAEEYSQVDFTSNQTSEEFHQMVGKAKEYIKAGDIFQVVLSQRFSSEFKSHPFTLYRTLRRINPSPFLFYLNFDDCALVGSSPEILVRIRGDETTIRPIAGTRPRGKTPEEDASLEQELLADPKETAEHLMLLDLGRNDVGKTAELGTVQVTDKFTIERYSHVMHIVSNVTGKLRPGSDAVDALMAGFPAGTVSGAPKIRAMEIIAELERDQRGPYAGCIGYFSADGNVDTCIALRTAIIKDGTMHIQAGAGVVADSDPEAEYQECFNKASALMRAAELASSR